MEAKDKAKSLASIVSTMTYAEWSRARVEIEKQFDQEKAKARLTNKDKLADAIEHELSW